MILILNLEYRIQELKGIQNILQNTSLVSLEETVTEIYYLLKYY